METRNMKGQSNLVGALIGLMLVVIIGLAVTVSVVTDIINTVNITGTARTVVNLFPLLIVVVVLIAITTLMGVGRR